MGADTRAVASSDGVDGGVDGGDGRDGMSEPKKRGRPKTVLCPRCKVREKLPGQSYCRECRYVPKKEGKPPKGIRKRKAAIQAMDATVEPVVMVSTRVVDDTVATEDVTAKHYAVQAMETEVLDPPARIVVDPVGSAGTVVFDGAPDKSAKCPDTCGKLHEHVR